MVGVTEVYNTLWIGLIYMVLGLPLTLSYRTTGIINFVHINFITIGAYVGVLLSLLGIKNVFIVALFAFAVGAAIAVFDNVAVFKPLAKRGANVVILMVASLGLWIFYKYFIYAIVDIIGKVVRENLVSVILELDILPSFTVGSIGIDGKFLTTLTLSALVAFFYYFVLIRTSVGKAIRAVSDNPQLAEISGIPRDRVVNFMWVMTGGAAAIGGLLWGMFAIVTPEVGDWLILQIFAVAVIGGLSSLVNTAIGAFIIAGAENIVMAALHEAFGLPLSFRPFITFMVLVIVILVKPPLGAGGGLPYRFLKPKKR